MPDGRERVPSAAGEPTAAVRSQSPPEFSAPASLQVDQNVRGDRNIPIGQATNVTIHQYDGRDRPSRSGKPFLMPPLPDYFVERPEEQQKVKDSLMSMATDSSNRGTLVVSAIYGLGGIGKSVLAAAIAHDAEVQNRFEDGILWVTLGQEPDLLPLLSAWIQELGDRDFKPTTVDAASMHLRSLLYDKRVLVVVDDVWNPDHAEPFRVGGEGCRVLVTTREADIRGAKRYDLEEMSLGQAVELLTKKYPASVTEGDLQQAEALAKAVGKLPLALELAAAQLEDGVTFAELLEDLQAEVARLEILDRPGAALSEKMRRNYSLTASLNLSLQRLSPEQLKQFAWLGVLPEDILVNETVAATLWEVTPKQAGAALRNFRSRALLLAGAKQVGQKPTYRLHDLMHDMSRRLLTSSPEPQDDHDLPGLGLPLADAHSVLLKRYRQKTTNGKWHTLPEDGYIHNHLTWHLEQVGRLGEIHQLLQEETEEGRNGWYEACEALGQTASFVTDVGRAWRLAEELYSQNPVEAIRLQCWYALVVTTLNTLASNLPPELIAALVKNGHWQPMQGLVYAQRVQDEEDRVNVLRNLAPYLPPSLHDEALKLVREIQSPCDRANALVNLVPYIPEIFSEVVETINQSNSFRRNSLLRKLISLMPESMSLSALQLVQQIESESDRVSALKDLAPRIPESMLSEVLHITGRIQDDKGRSSLLHTLSLRMPNVLSEALAAARQIRDPETRFSALIELVDSVPEMSSEVFEVIQQIQSDSKRASALVQLAPYISEQMLPSVIDVARKIQDVPERASVIGKLAQFFPTLLQEEALEVARQVDDPKFRSAALKSLAPYLPEALQEALEAARQIDKADDRVVELGGLVRYLPEELLPETLEAAMQIESAYTRALTLWVSSIGQQRPISEIFLRKALEEVPRLSDETIRGEVSSRDYVLGELMGVLPDTLLKEALEVCRLIYDQASQAVALLTLVHQLPELPPKILVITQKIQDEKTQAFLIKRLVPYLPESMLPEVLRVAQKIQDEESRSSALCELFSHLPDSLLPRALELTHQIQDEKSKSSLLCELVAYVPESLLPQALEIIQQIQHEESRLLALSEIVQHFSESMLPIALELTRKIQNDYHRVLVFCSLVPRLPDLLPEVLETIKQLQSVGDQAIALNMLVPYSPELSRETLETIRKIQDEWDLTYELRKLIPHLSEPMLLEALEMIRQIQNHGKRAFALIDLLSYLQPTSLETLEITQQVKVEVLEAVHEIQESSDLAYILIPLIPYLSESLLLEALEMTRQCLPELLDDPHVNVNRSMREALADLPESLLPEALAVIKQMRSELQCAIALQALVPHLPNLMLSEALQVTLQMQSGLNRAIAFQAIAPRLTEISSSYDLWCEALHSLSHLNREEFLPTLAKLEPSITALGGKEAILAMVEAMRHICSQWK
jgi:uncharacterized protein YeeX (DUF496 family)